MGKIFSVRVMRIAAAVIYTARRAADWGAQAASLLVSAAAPKQS